MKFSQGKPKPLLTADDFCETTVAGRHQLFLRQNLRRIHMLTSLAFIFLAGLFMAGVCQRLHLPRIIGMLFTGILLGPYLLNLLDSSILSISSDLRQMAMIIFLIKVWLTLYLSDLKKVGRPAILLSCVPATCEILVFLLFAHAMLHITRAEAAVMGAVLAAVSPARTPPIKAASTRVI